MHPSFKGDAGGSVVDLGYPMRLYYYNTPMSACLSILYPKKSQKAEPLSGGLRFFAASGDGHAYRLYSLFMRL